MMRDSKRLDAPFWGSVVVSLVLLSCVGCFTLAALQ
jgi:hypothetical protein